jgi:hypothetical protein
MTIFDQNERMQYQNDRMSSGSRESMQRPSRDQSPGLGASHGTRVSVDKMFALLAEDAKGQPRRSRKSVQEFDEELKEAQTKRLSIGGYNVLNVEASPDGTKWIETSQADVCVGAVIALNCIVVGFETDFRKEAGTVWTTDDILWYVVDNFFTLVFLFELKLRIQANGLRKWSKSGWNLFDFSLVVMSLVDTYILAFVLAGAGIGSVTIARMFRLLRLFRALRLVRVFPELQLLVHGLIRAFQSMLWVLMLMFCIMYVWAILGVRFIGAKENRNDCAYKNNAEGCVDCTASENLGENACLLEKYFTSVMKALYSMFIVMTGESWVTICDCAAAYLPGVEIAFIIYYAITAIALVNLVTGVIVDSVYETKVADERSHAHANA